MYPIFNEDPIIQFYQTIETEELLWERLYQILSNACISTSIIKLCFGYRLFLTNLMLKVSHRLHYFHQSSHLFMFFNERKG